MKARVPRRNSVDVEIRKRDEDASLVGAVEQIVALDVAWVQTGKVGRRESTVRSRFVVELEGAICLNQPMNERTRSHRLDRSCTISKTM